MYRFIRKNNKKLLAVFAAFLMVVFILPAGLDQMGGGSDPVLGKLGDDEIHASEFQAAEQEWKILNDLRGGMRTRFGAPLPFAYRLGWNEMSEFELMQGRPPVPVRAITANPRLFLLLYREAQRLGIGVSADRVNDIMVNELAGNLPADRDALDRIRSAIEHLLMIEVAYERASSVIKVSEPATRHELARRSQNVTVRAAEFPAAAYAEKAPAPATQQVQAHFEKFAKLDPVVHPSDNPFGFGYRYPNRVRFQYIAIPRDEVRKAVEAGKTEYEWEVEAQKYYLQNQSQFPTTQKSPSDEAPFSLAGPTTGPATRSAATQAAAPTTRPFAEVKEDAKNRIIVPEVERRVTEIQNRITALMAADYQAFRSAGGGTTQPTTGASASASAAKTSQGVPYNSYEYLQRLAQTIQGEFKVLPAVAAFDDKLRSAEELRALEKIGTAFGEEGQPFDQYLTALAQPFLPEADRDNAAALAVLAPSRPFRDMSSNVYMVRLTEADPAHAPASLAEVQDAVRADLQAAAAYEAAKADATKLLEQAKQGGLQQAAQSSQRNVLTVGPFPADLRGTLPGLDIKSDEATAAFVSGAFDLLAVQPTADGKRVGLIELHKPGRIFVAELADVSPRPQMATLGSPHTEVERALNQELQQYFQIQWFNFDDAKKRLAYTSSEPPRDRPADTAGPSAPLPRPLPM